MIASEMRIVLAFKRHANLSQVVAYHCFFIIMVQCLEDCHIDMLHAATAGSRGCQFSTQIRVSTQIQLQNHRQHSVENRHRYLTMPGGRKIGYLIMIMNLC